MKRNHSSPTREREQANNACGEAGFISSHQFILKSYNCFMVTKLSKSQRFILLEAAKSLPGLEAEAKEVNQRLRSAVAIGILRPGFRSVEPSDLSHTTRDFIPINFFKLSSRKTRFGGRVAELYGVRITDKDTNRIDAEAAGKQYNRANPSLYRAIKRLEQRGLIKRIAKPRGNLLLPAQGVAGAKALKTLITLTMVAFLTITHATAGWVYLYPSFDWYGYRDQYGVLHAFQADGARYDNVSKVYQVKIHGRWLTVG